MEKEFEYKSEIYPNGITVIKEACQGISVSFKDEKKILSIPCDYSNEMAILAILYSVSIEQINKVQVSPGDTLLILADGVEGLVLIITALARALKVFFVCTDKKIRDKAKEYGVTTFDSFALMNNLILEKTNNEGPNIIIDLTAIEGRMEILINQIASQACRIVIGRRDHITGSYQMRMGSYKEIDIFGLDRCNKIHIPDNRAYKLLCELEHSIELRETVKK